MKIKMVKEVKRSDGLWRFACGDVYIFWLRWFGDINLSSKVDAMSGLQLFGADSDQFTAGEQPAAFTTPAVSTASAQGSLW